MVPKQPVPDSYHLSREVGSGPVGSLDTAHVYVFENDVIWNYPNGNFEFVHTYKYLKFSPRGIALFSADSRDSISSINVVGIAVQYCFYKIAGDNLTLEFYDVLDRKFHLWYGKVYPDKIQFYKDKLRVFNGGRSKLDGKYYKKNIRYNWPIKWPE